MTSPIQRRATNALTSLRALPLALALTLFLGAFGVSLPAQALSPIIDLTDQPVPGDMTLSKVKQGIQRGAAQRNWILKDQGNNAFEATLFNRKYVVKVKITYNRSSYSISYISSQNMKAQNGKIHRKYNGWVRNLSNDIQRALYELS